MNPSDRRSFGEDLRAFREQKRMSQLQLAQALGVNRQTIVAWELSKNPPKDRTRVLELARILGLDTEETNVLLAAAFLDPLPLWHIPYHRNPLFTGREEFLLELHRVLVPGTTAAVTQSRVISGLGGIGKTQTALEYTYRYREDYSAVIWLQADSREIFFLACVQLAQELGLPEQNEADQARIVAAIKRWLKGKAKWLLILDNVEDFLMIEEVLPPGHHGCVLLTTRTHQVTEHIALIHELEVLSEEEGVLLLLRRAGLLALDAPLELAAPVDYAQAKELWERVEGLPLALDQIGAYVRATGCSLAHYRALYVDQQRRFDLLKERGKIPPGHPESVVATFSVAFEKVHTANLAAAEMLQAFAFLHAKAIPEEIITKGEDHLGSRLFSIAGDPLLFDQAVDVLQTYSLVRRDAQENMLSVHQLLQAVLQDTMPASDQEVWIERVISAINSIFPSEVALSNVEHLIWGQCERLVPHVLACTAHALSRKGTNAELDLASLLVKTAKYLRDRAQYTQAEPLLLQALASYTKQLGLEHPLTASCLHDLAELTDDQGHYEEAKLLYQQALAIYEQVLGPNHPDTAKSLNSLAEFYRNQGKYEEAELPYQRALSIREQTFGPDHPNVAESLNALAKLYDDRGKYEAAELLYQRALVIYEKSFGPEHLAVAYTLNNLAILYDNLGNFAQAELFYQRALSIREKVYGPEHPRVADSLNNLATLYWSQGKYTLAERFYLQALELSKRMLGSEHPDIADSLNNLALVYHDQGKFAQAEVLYQQALELRTRALGPEHPGVAGSLNNLAALYVTQGRFAQAEVLYQQALELHRKSLDHQRLDGTAELSHFVAGQDKFAQAEHFYQRALAICQRALGPNHPDVAASICNLADAYIHQGKYEQAKLLCQQGIPLWEKALGQTIQMSLSASLI
jgi:tetratricopeptide (TPR) repeat protein/transcriptional regulator with XRE-family HTH domain